MTCYRPDQSGLEQAAYVEISSITMYIHSHAVFYIVGLEGQPSCRLKSRIAFQLPLHNEHQSLLITP